MKIKGTNVSIALLVLCIMGVLIVVIRLSPNFQQQQKYTLPSFEEFSKPYIPFANTTTRRTKAQLGSRELLSQQVSATAPDGQSIQLYVSKPQGQGPFPVVIMLHDGPSSTKVSRDLSLTLGETLMAQHQVITVAVDRRDSTSVDSEIIDLVAAIDGIADFEEVNSQSIALLGDGRGAHTILSLLQLNQATQIKAIDGVFLFNPYVNPAAVWGYQRIADEKESAFFPSYYGCKTTDDTQQETMNACLALYTLQDDDRIATPMTVVTTSGNKRVPAEEAEAVAALAGAGNQVTKKTIETADVSGAIIGKSGTTEMDQLLGMIDSWIQTMRESWNTTIIPATGEAVTNSNTNTSIDAPVTNSATNSEVSSDESEASTKLTLPSITE